MLISADQIRAARALKNWSQSDLAERTGMAVPSIANIELGKQKPSAQTIAKIMEAFALAGIKFTSGDGVQKSYGDISVHEGTEGFRNFMTDVYETARDVGGEIRLFNATPANWLKWLGEDWYFNFYAKRMQAIKDRFDFKITVKENDWDFIGKNYAEYRWFPEKLFSEDASFYAYGDKLAFLDFKETSVRIIVLHQKEFAAAFKALFNCNWDSLSIIPHK
ncbi:MAG: helix-turn-helix domain-containing protein [Rhodospirillales bacterium]|nr:helix-turn-helix domain-containing protein [Rhodospirillales bacterium]